MVKPRFSAEGLIAQAAIGEGWFVSIFEKFSIFQK